MQTNTDELRENTLNAVFTEEIRLRFFTYLHGYTDAMGIGAKNLHPSDFRRTRFWWRYGPITNFTEKEVERKLMQWLEQFCYERNNEIQA